MYEKVSALNNLQWLVCHKTQPTNEPTKLFSLPQLQYVDIFDKNKVFCANHPGNFLPWKSAFRIVLPSHRLWLMPANK